MMGNPRAVTAFVLLSGGATLVLELAWVRHLGLVLGRSHGALLAVTCGFLAGLCLGARWSERMGKPLSGTGWAHVTAGVLAFLFPLATSLLDRVLALAYQTSDASLWLVSTLGLTAGSVLILIPATLLGTALPLAIRSENDHGRAGRAAFLSGVTALGGSIGTYLAGFVLLPTLGTTATGWIGGLLSLVAGGVALAVGASPVACRRKTTATPAGIATAPAALLCMILTTGAVGMVLELSWIRYFTMVLGSTTFVLTTILATYIGATAIGGFVAGRWTVRWHERESTTTSWACGAAPILAGVLCLALLHPMGRLPIALIDTFAHATSFAGLQFVLFFFTTAIVIGPCLFVGAQFPLILAEGRRRAGREIDPGRVVAASTFGTVIGSLLWSGALIPRFGLHGTIGLASITLIGLGGIWCTGRIRGLLPALALALLMARSPAPWDPGVMACGAYQYAKTYARKADQVPGRDLEKTIASFGRILSYVDGTDAAVAIREEQDGTRSLLIDGKTDAATLRDMRTQRLLGHLPALLKPKGSALVIGLGSGVTVGSVLAHPLDRVDVVEIVPAVIRSAPFFSADSRAPLLDPRTRVIQGDARTHVAWTKNRYDLITSEPTNPWVAGASALFSDQFFARCHRALSPGGVVCQWIPAYHQSQDDFRAIIAGFLRSFPGASLWESSRGQDYLLVGSDGPVAFRYQALKNAFANRRVVADLEEVELRDPEDLLARFMCGPAVLSAFVRGTSPVSDDLLQPEFSGPRSRFLDLDGSQIAASLERLREDPAVLVCDPPPGLHPHIVARRLKEEALTRLRSGETDKAQECLDAARSCAEKVGGSLSFLKGFYLATIRDKASQGDVKTAQDDVGRVAELLPGDPDIENEQGRLMMTRGELEPARAFYLEMVRRHPAHVHAWRNLGVLAAQGKDLPTAANAFRRAIELAPFEPELHNCLGRILVFRGELTEAHEQFSRATALDPACAESRQGLIAIAKALGQNTSVSAN